MNKEQNRIITGFYWLTILLLLPALSGVSQTKENYGNTPDEMVPYGRYQKSHKPFFDEPQPFLGPGRDKPEPVGLETVRIGFLGPLEGSIERHLGMQMLQEHKWLSKRRMPGEVIKAYPMN